MVVSEAEARKRRSIALLQAQGVPYLENLPRIESSGEAKIQSGPAVVRRAMCLFLVSLAAINRNRPGALRTLQRWEVMDALTPRERRFLERRELIEQDRVQLSWRCEAVLPLMWSVGMVELLPYPDQIVNVDWMAEFWRPARPGFWREFHTRDPDEILDEADLIYRYHWAARTADLKGEPMPAALDLGVVMERHHALNWLIRSCGEAWDDVACHT